MINIEIIYKINLLCFFKESKNTMFTPQVNEIDEVDGDFAPACFGGAVANTYGNVVSGLSFTKAV